jgi:hypothetical protein
MGSAGSLSAGLVVTVLPVDEEDEEDELDDADEAASAFAACLAASIWAFVLLFLVVTFVTSFVPVGSLESSSAAFEFLWSLSDSSSEEQSTNGGGGPAPRIGSGFFSFFPSFLAFFPVGFGAISETSKIDGLIMSLCEVHCSITVGLILAWEKITGYSVIHASLG